ncbi:MAG: ABC transporter permease subunit [Candidatus Thermoplasmatota archaeon]|nr:ABC transporter permease subunit [Candidatus Thermoplasmatota archaeon]MEC8609232.1 ABC transporter permease subunit [Candidatus Thermoplasmatota archaeon]
MSRRKRIVIVAKKEIIEFVRDWRTIVALVLIPLLLFPLLFIAFPIVMQNEAAELDQKIVDVLIQSDDIDQALIDIIENQSAHVTIMPLDKNLTTLSDPNNNTENLRNFEYDAILRLELRNDTWYYAILHLSTSEQSNEARSRLLDVLIDWEEGLTTQRIESAGLDADSTLNPLRWDGVISDADVATKGEQAGMLLSLFIPFVLAIWTASAAVQPSIDMTVGERERGTLESLLSLPLTRTELLLGKWLAVVSITAVGVALQITGLLFGIAYLASDFIDVPSLSIGAILLLTLAVGFYGTMIVALYLALAMRSKSVKEAGSVLTPITLAMIMPILLTQFINLDDVEMFWFGVPFVNVLLGLRELLLNRIIIEHVIVWTLVSSLICLLTVRYAAKQFHREDIITTKS